MTCSEQDKSKSHARKNPLYLLMKACFALLTLNLAGCMDLYEPSTINENPIEISEEAFLQDVALDDVDEQYIRALAHHYKRYGSSPMDLLVTYDPHSKDNTAMVATNKVADISEVLRLTYGVENVDAGIMPIASQHEAPRLLVSYDSLSAHAPKGCDGMMPGLEGRPMEDDSRYKLGCSLATLKMRQVARPADLMGQGVNSPNTEGRSATNIVDTYRSGAQLEPLDGENASEN